MLSLNLHKKSRIVGDLFGIGVIHLLRTHEKRRRSSRSVRHACKGKGFDSSQFVRKNVAFCMYVLIF